MNEQWSGVKKLVPVELFPLVRSSPRLVTLCGQWECWRREAEHIKNQGLAVSGPTILNEACFGSPTVRDRQCTVLGPLPIRPGKKRTGEFPDLALIFCLAIEIAGRRECAGYQVGSIDGRDLRLHCTPPGLHVEEVIIKAFITSCVRPCSLRAIVKESQRRQRSTHSFGSTQVLALDCDRIRGERKADHRD